MSTAAQRWLVPVVAALAVLAVVAGAFAWAQRSGDGDGAGAGSGGGGAPPYAGVEPGSPGSGPGGSPGEPGTDPGDDTTSDPDAIPVAGFYRYDDRHLALNYYNGVPECYGDAGVPEVVERADAVLVRIPRTSPTGPSDAACIDIAVAGSVDVALDAPLGDRQVLDVSRQERPVKEEPSPYSKRQTS